MPTDVLAAPARSREEELYRRRTPASGRAFQEARQFLPGGDSRSTLFYPPYPAVMDRGEGCWLFDLDGNRLLDFTGNHSSLILGYGHPAIVEAVRLQLARGTCFPGSTAAQTRLASLLCERLASVDLVRFANSGTEAAMQAIRAARAFTGRHGIAKVEGGYHGTADEVMVSTHPTSPNAGEPSHPLASPGSRGLGPGATGNAVVIPFNDPEAIRLIEAERDWLAAVVVEPIMGSAGMIPAERDYLEALREITRRLGILLIFDEVISFRIAFGGAAEYFGVSPDLTILGKLIGGGFPLGAFGGRSDIMALFDPSQGPPAIPHPGSYNANPVSLVAGAATLEVLSRSAIEALNLRGESVRAMIRAGFEEAAFPVQVTGLGSLFAIHLTRRPVRSSRDSSATPADLRHRLFLGLFNEGVLIDPRGVGTVSVAIGDAEIERFSEALRAVLRRLPQL